jgi:hypothetical protein
MTCRMSTYDRLKIHGMKKSLLIFHLIILDQCTFTHSFFNQKKHYYEN